MESRIRPPPGAPGRAGRERARRSPPSLARRGARRPPHGHGRGAQCLPTSVDLTPPNAAGLSLVDHAARGLRFARAADGPGRCRCLSDVLGRQHSLEATGERRGRLPRRDGQRNRRDHPTSLRSPRIRPSPPADRPIALRRGSSGRAASGRALPSRAGSRPSSRRTVRSERRLRAHEHAGNRHGVFAGTSPPTSLAATRSPSSRFGSRASTPRWPVGSTLASTVARFTGSRGGGAATLVLSSPFHAADRNELRFLNRYRVLPDVAGSEMAYCIWTTAVVSPVDIEIISAGREQGPLASLLVNGHEIVTLLDGATTSLPSTAEMAISGGRRISTPSEAARSRAAWPSGSAPCHQDHRSRRRQDRRRGGSSRPKAWRRSDRSAGGETSGALSGSPTR